MTALKLNLGAAPAGPAGTGKTQSSKFLARLLGQFCVVTNCSDQLMGSDLKKILKGVASSGVWSTFD